MDTKSPVFYKNYQRSLNEYAKLTKSIFLPSIKYPHCKCQIKTQSISLDYLILAEDGHSCEVTGSQGNKTNMDNTVSFSQS